MNKKCCVIICFITTFLLFGVVVLLTMQLTTQKNAKFIYNKSIKSIVEVKAETSEIGESYGSAVIYDDGYAITNAHVISYSNMNNNILFETITIRFAHMERYIEAEVIKIDYDLDLAIISFNDENIDYKKISFSKKDYCSGDLVYAIGNSSNYGIGISEGIISVNEVNVIQDEKIRTVIQCDINISSGNSGGALLDKKGCLIGITTFRTKDLKGNINYGFVYSIPLKTIIDFIK